MKLKIGNMYERIFYVTAAEDEISFDPDDIITHIEMVRVCNERSENFMSNFLL